MGIYPPRKAREAGHGGATHSYRGAQPALQCLRAVCGGTVPRLQSSRSTRGDTTLLIETSKMPRWQPASPAGPGERAARCRTVWIRRLQSMVQATSLTFQFNPSRVIPCHVRLIVSTDPPVSPESSPSATGRCPGLRYTSEVGGVRLPMGPAFGLIVYELSST